MEQEKLLKQRHAKELEMLKVQKTWDARIEKIRKRKEKPMNEAQFCEKYGFIAPAFSRLKKLRQCASEKTIKDVEKAFRAEGV